ncbi:hypothetical protein HRbin36_01181 [bacterium HR36]|nr:hypothetical protein HRbin36_01181 [bacterium HR36]
MTKDRSELLQVQKTETEAPSPPALPHRARILPNAVDVTGRVPDDVRIDPNITEGYPGYDESGESEIIPLDRLTGGQTES